MRNTLQQKTNISREKLAVLEELLSTKQKEYEENLQNYNQKNKDREIDILWQELKSNREERSPGVYLSIGFVVGALAMFLMTSIINFGVQSDNTADFNVWKKSSLSSNAKQASINVAPAGAEASADKMVYTIKNGDTLETIAVKYYGVASQANINKIQKANNIKNPHSIQMGQKIVVPISE